jgi:hypothetical protein
MLGCAFLCHDRASRESLPCHSIRSLIIHGQPEFFKEISRSKEGLTEFLPNYTDVFILSDKCSLFSQMLRHPRPRAGFGEICAAIRLRIAGYSSFLVIERV